MKLFTMTLTGSTQELTGSGVGLLKLHSLNSPLQIFLILQKLQSFRAAVTPVNYEHDSQYVISVWITLKNLENNRMVGIGWLTPHHSQQLCIISCQYTIFEDRAPEPSASLYITRARVTPLAGLDQYAKLTLNTVSWNSESKWPNELEGNGQWPPFFIPAESIPGCMFGANLVISA